MYVFFFQMPGMSLGGGGIWSCRKINSFVDNCDLYQTIVCPLQYLTAKITDSTANPGNGGLLGMKKVHFLTGSLVVTNGTEVTGRGQDNTKERKNLNQKLIA